MEILDSRFRGNDRKGMEMAYKKVRMIGKKTGMLLPASKTSWHRQIRRRK